VEKKLKCRQVLGEVFRCLRPLLLIVPVFALERLARTAPSVVESVYSRGIYPVVSQGISFVTRFVPVSLSELLLIAAPLLVIIGFVRMVRKKLPARRFFHFVAILVTALYCSFVLLWSLNYSRLPYADIASLPVQPSSAEELAGLAASLVERVNTLRKTVTIPERTMETRLETLKMVPAAYKAAAEEAPWLAGSYGPPKPALLSWFLATGQITGIFLPFTLEAHVNTYETMSMLPATACHEAAHQHGFAREDEANFVAYYVCTRSGNEYFEYSGALSALMYVMSSLHSASPERYAEIREQYSDAVVSDLREYYENWEPFEGPVSEMQDKVNDAYLKSNGLEDGVRSYGRMVDLLLAEYRVNSAREK